MRTPYIRLLPADLAAALVAAAPETLRAFAKDRAKDAAVWLGLDQEFEAVAAALAGPATPELAGRLSDLTDRLDEVAFSLSDTPEGKAEFVRASVVNAVWGPQSRSGARPLAVAARTAYELHAATGQWPTFN